MRVGRESAINAGSSHGTSAILAMATYHTDECHDKKQQWKTDRSNDTIFFDVRVLSLSKNQLPFAVSKWKWIEGLQLGPAQGEAASMWSGRTGVEHLCVRVFGCLGWTCCQCLGL